MRWVKDSIRTELRPESSNIKTPLDTLCNIPTPQDLTQSPMQHEPKNDAARVTIPIHGVIESIDGTKRKFTVSNDFVVVLVQMITAPESNADGDIIHATRILLETKSCGWIRWQDVAFEDTEEFKVKRAGDLAETEISGMAADHQDEQDAKAAAAQAMAFGNNQFARSAVVQALLTKCEFSF